MIQLAQIKNSIYKQVVRIRKVKAGLENIGRFSDYLRAELESVLDQKPTASTTRIINFRRNDTAFLW